MKHQRQISADDKATPDEIQAAVDMFCSSHADLVRWWANRGDYITTQDLLDWAAEIRAGMWDDILSTEKPADKPERPTGFHLTDHTDFCRQCRGHGRESDGLGGSVHCDECDGTGKRGFRVSELERGLTMAGERNVRDAERRAGADA